MQTGQYFDATQVAPDQGGQAHPVGKFPARVTATDIKPTKDGAGNYLEVEYTTPQGKQTQRFNLWNNSAQAVEIAHKQLSALCHVTNVFRLDFANKAAALLQGNPFMIEVRMQSGNTGYSEVSRLYDANGNEPGKAPAQQQPAAPAQPGPAQQWGAPAPAAAPQPAAQPQSTQGQPWAPGGNAGGAAPGPAPWAR